MSPSPVHFFYQIRSFTFRNRRKLKAFIGQLLQKEQTQAEEIRVIFCTDRQLLQINQNYLKHDFYTDIITFNLGNPGNPVNAELYISIDRVKENAVSAGVSFSTELHRVIFHGILHLCGYNDKSSQQIKKMRAAEDRYLRLYFA